RARLAHKCSQNALRYMGIPPSYPISLAKRERRFVRTRPSATMGGQVCRSNSSRKGDAMSADYDRILEAINFDPPPPPPPLGPPSKALMGIYDNDPTGPQADPRKFLAYALGDGNDKQGDPTKEVVLAYQYAGYRFDAMHPAKNWRCFEVAKFAQNGGVTEIDFASPNPPPDPLKPNERHRQNCVMKGIPQGQPKFRETIYHT